MAQQSDMFLYYNMAVAVILFYILATICWFACAAMVGQYSRFLRMTSIFMGFLWLYYGYRNYHFYFMKNYIVTFDVMRENVAGALILTILSFSLYIGVKRILKALVK